MSKVKLPISLKFPRQRAVDCLRSLIFGLVNTRMSLTRVSCNWTDAQPNLNHEALVFHEQHIDNSIEHMCQLLSIDRQEMMEDHLPVHFHPFAMYLTEVEKAIMFIPV